MSFHEVGKCGWTESHICLHSPNTGHSLQGQAIMPLISEKSCADSKSVSLYIYSFILILLLQQNESSLSSFLWQSFSIPYVEENYYALLSILFSKLNVPNLQTFISLFLEKENQSSFCLIPAYHANFSYSHLPNAPVINHQDVGTVLGKYM